MKWIGQHIYDLVARFRNDIYLEGISTSTETDMLVVDSNNKVSKRAIDAITVDVSDFMTNGSDNRVLTATGTDAMNAEANFTFNGSSLALTGVMDISPANDAGAPALTIDNDDIDQYALYVDAANTTADAIHISAQAITTRSALGIDCNSLTTGSGISLDVDDALTSATTKSLLKIDYDKSGVTAAEVISTITGLDINMADAATNNADATVTSTGVNVTIDAASDQGTINQTGYSATLTDGDVASTIGYYSNVENGGIDFKAVSSGNTADYFKISTTTHGATTMETVDADAGSANLVITADGTVDIDGRGGITLDSTSTINLEAAANIESESGGTWKWWKAGNTSDYLQLDIGTHGDAAFTTVDAAAAAAHMSFAPDGDLKLTPGTGTTYFYDSDNAYDYLTLAIGTHGDAKFTTVDTAAANANIELEADGDITLDAAGGIFLEPTDGIVRLTNTTTSSSSQGGKLNLICDDGAAMGDDHQLGKIGFWGAEDGSSTLREGVSIRAYADAAWSDTENGTRLEFYTKDADNTSELSLTLDSDLLATFAGAVTVTGALTATASTNNVGTITTGVWNGTAIGGNYIAATQPNIDSIGTDDDTLSILGDTISVYNATTNMPLLKMANTTNDATGPRINLFNQRTDGSIQAGQDNDVLGKISFWGYDDQGTPGLQQYGMIYGDIHDATSGQESGRLTFQVANHDGGLGSGLILTGGDQDDTIDATIGLGASSITTTSGQLAVNGSALTVQNSSSVNVIFEDEADNDQGGRLKLRNQRGGSSTQDGQDNDRCGEIYFQSYNDAGTPELITYSEIVGKIHDATDGEESGKLQLRVANHDGGAEDGLVLTGGSADGEVDVTIGNGSASVTTIAGDLSVTGDTNLYSYAYITWSASATPTRDGSNNPEWMLPNNNKGIYEEDWNADSNITATSTGTTTYSLSRYHAVNSLVIPHTGILVGFHGHGRNGDSDLTFKAGLFHADGSTTSATNATGIDYGNTAANNEFTLRCVATADEAEASGGTDGTSNHSFKGPCKLVSNTANLAVSAGDALMPAIMGNSSNSTDEIFVTMTIILKIPLTT